MCPTSLQEHLDFHSGRLLTYDLLKAEVDAYLDVKHAAALAGGGATPMDLDTFRTASRYRNLVGTVGLSVGPVVLTLQTRAN